MRKGTFLRTTEETNIGMDLCIDGKGEYLIDTGIGFFDHMLCLMSKHGLMDLKIKAKGDIHVDCHHTVEDVGIVLGKCVKEAVGDKKGIKRYGSAVVPMDEALVMVTLDLSGRAYTVFNGKFNSPNVGNMSTESVEEFFTAVAFNGEMNIHVNVLYGKNTHHIIEAIFKAFGRALREATTIDTKIKGIMSTKGSL